MTDDQGMNTNATSTESTEVRADRRLVRPVAGRSIAGVAAGLANYLDLPVNWIRLGFIVSALFGGLGVVLYLAGWVLIRDETEPDTIAERVIGNIGSGSSWLGVALVIIGAVIVLDVFTFMPGSLIWAMVLVVVGVFLYRGDLGPKERPTTDAATASTALVDGPPSPESAVTPTKEIEAAPPAPPTTPITTYGPPPPPAEPPPPPSILGRLIIGVGLLALGVLAVVDNLSSAVDAQPRHYIALATVTLGVGLLVGAFIGRARWTILLGVFLVPALFASPVAEVDWEGRFEWIVAPTAESSLAPAYRATAGSYRFDLTEAEWDGQTEELNVDLAAGEIVVIVPEDVAITGEVRVGAGAIESPDGERGGVGGIERRFDLPGDRGALDLDLDVGVGVVEIRIDRDSTTGWNSQSETVLVTERSR